MKTLNLFNTHATKTIRIMDGIFYSALSDKKYAIAFKAHDAKMKLLQKMHPVDAPVLQLESLNLEDIPMACLKKWHDQSHDHNCARKKYIGVHFDP